MVCQPLRSSVMSCLNALHSQIITLLSVPHETLLLQHKVFREYAKIAVGPDFVHTLPSFIVITAMALILWKNPPQSRWIAHVVGFEFAYKTLQVSVSWVIINAVLWLWLVFQRVLYCSVWTHWSYETEYRDVSYPWWQRVWSSYYPPPLQPPVMSSGFLSWIVSMIIAATTLGCAISANRVRILIEESLFSVQDALIAVLCFTKWSLKRLRQVLTSNTKIPQRAEEDCSEVSSVCDDCRSELSTDVNQAARDVHPISYGTNWMPKPNFKEPKRKMSMKSLHTVTGANDLRGADISPQRQLRHRRGCHTVIPSNSSDKSSGC